MLKCHPVKVKMIQKIQLRQITYCDQRLRRGIIKPREAWDNLLLKIFDCLNNPFAIKR